MSNFNLIEDDEFVPVVTGEPTAFRERSLSEIEREVLSLANTASLDSLCAALDASDWLLARARTIHHLAKQIAVSWIDSNGEFDIGDIHYSVGYSVAIKCLSVPQTAHAVLDAAAGDLDRLLEVLVSQPFKHASVRSLIGRPLHDKLFAARRTASLKNGVPGRDLKRVDRRFLR